MDWHIGTMGFSYPDWTGPFYPAKLKPADFLAAYAESFDVVELDTTFYGTPAPERVRRWVDQVPAHFRFCPKVPRAITHDAPLTLGGEFRHFLDAVRHFGTRLGAVLLQFPPSFANREYSRLAMFLRGLPEDLRFAIEFRHPSWENEQTFDLLHKHRCAWVAGDYGTDPFPIHATTDLLYVRLIGIHGHFATHEQERFDMTERLAWWQRQIETCARLTSQAYIMVNNDYAGHAPATANRLKQLLGQKVSLPAGEVEATLF